MRKIDLLKSLFGLQLPEPTPEPEPRKTASAWYSTHSAPLRNIGAKDVGEGKPVVLEMPNFKTTGEADGESFAFDEAVESFGMDAATLKGVFTLNQGAIPDDLFNWYSRQGFIGFQAMAIVSQHWLVNKALRIPAIDALRNGYEIASVDQEELETDFIAKLKRYDKKFKLKKNLIEFETNKRLFGYRIAVFNVESDDPKYYEKIFNIDGVTENSYKGITQVDPSWVAPMLDRQAAANPASMDFYEPTWWMISGQLYHRSHLVVARYIDPPDILKPTYQYGGISLTQHILERVYAAERTANEAPMLAETKRLNVIHTDLALAAADPEGLEGRLQEQVSFMDNYGVRVVGTDDVIEQFDTSLSDLDAVIMNQYQLVSAISGVPSTKLLGTSPKGFNATGEFEERSYHELLETIQVDMELVIDRHHELVIQSEMGGKKNVEIVWNSVSTLSAKEQEEINLLKAQTVSALSMTGAIDAEEIREQLIADKKSGFNGLESFEDDEENDEDLGYTETGTLGDSEAEKLDEGGTIQETSLQAGQIDSMIDLVDRVSKGEMPKSTARMILMASHLMDRETADELLEDVKEDSQEPEDTDTIHGRETPPPKDNASEVGEVTAEDSGQLGYVRVQPTLYDSLQLDVWRSKAGIEGGVVPTDLHITLAHDSTGIENYVPSIATYLLRFTGEAGLLGDALVLFVESPQLRTRFIELQAMGAVWDYDDFNPHITLKYNPDPDDLMKVQAALKVSPLDDIATGAEIRQVT